MKFKLSTLGVSAGLLISAAVTAGSAKAQTTNSIPIVNATFTNPSVADGSYSVGAPTGWNASSSGGVGATLNRTTSPYVNQTGNQLAQIYSTSGWSGFFNQVLSYDFVPGDTYTLTANICNDASLSGFNLAIDQAGVAILASTPITSTAANTLSAFSVSWTDPLSGGGSLSSPIEVAVYNLTGAAGGAGLEMDNFQLSQVSPVPEPATWALFGVAMFCGLVVRHTIKRRQA